MANIIYININKLVLEVLQKDPYIVGNPLCCRKAAFAAPRSLRQILDNIYMKQSFIYVFN